MDKNSKIAFGVVAVALGMQAMKIRLTHKRLVNVRDTLYELLETIEQAEIDHRFITIVDELDI